MKLVRVRAKEGRKAFTAPKGGKPISSSEEGTLVQMTPWLNKLINVHGDIEIVRGKSPPKVEKPSVKETKTETTKA